MHLYIVRHGKAEQDSASGLDKDRRLAAKGERQARWLGERIAGRADRPGVIISSPFVRADQTARLLNGSLEVELHHDERLIVDRPVSGVLEMVQEFSAFESVALVGHNPQLERLCGMLAGEPRFEMKTGMGAVFEIADPQNTHANARLIDVLRME